MELKKSAQEVLTQAQMLRLEAKTDRLCLEHVLYGLLLMASYEDEPMNDPELLTEAKELRGELKKKLRSIASAKKQLHQDALHSNALFSDAAEAIGRASEMAADGIICAMDLFRAIWETPSPMMRALSDLELHECISEDGKYGEMPRQQLQDVTVKPSEPVKPISPVVPSKDEKEEDDGATASQIIEALKILAILHDSQHNELLHNSGKVKKQKIRRRTKFGLFTYRGGTAAAAIQYFLFGIIVPFAAITLIEIFTGVISAPPNLLTEFLFKVFIVSWICYLGRGVARVVGLASNACTLFLLLMTDLVFIHGMTEAICDTWNLGATPIWLRIIVCLSAFFLLLIGTAMYDHLQSKGDVTKTKIMFMNCNGTPAKIFFQNLTRQLILPLLVFSIVWIFRIQVPVWLNKTLWILGFSWVWTNIGNIWACLHLRYTNSARRHKGKGFVTFMRVAHFMFGPVAMVIFLHWLFAWFPMKGWVIVILSVYALISLIMAAAAVKND